MSENFAEHFGDFDGRVWLNTAHQGALTRRGAAAAREAIDWKLSPHELTADRFRDVPTRLRDAAGQLLQVSPDEVIVANSASYGLHLVAQAFPWERGDEVLVVAGDFPSDILPWLLLEERHGVKVRRIRSSGPVPEPHEIEEAITPRTRLFCATWVHSFSGRMLDVERVGRICGKHDVVFLLNASQGLGAMPLDASSAPLDGIVCAGFKWLCGPYGTGICWLRPSLRERLSQTKAYWLAMQSQEDLGKPVGDVVLKTGLGARAYDVFGTANFFNFMPLAASIELLLALGVERIQDHDQALVSRLVEGLPDAYRLHSLPDGPLRSTLVFISHRDPSKNGEVHAALAAAGVDVALRNEMIRISPHLYNRPADVDRVLAILATASPSR